MTATVDLSDNTLAVFTQTPRKTIPSQQFEEGARKHTCTQLHNKSKNPENIPCAQATQQWHTRTTIMQPEKECKAWRKKTKTYNYVQCGQKRVWKLCNRERERKRERGKSPWETLRRRGRRHIYSLHFLWTRVFLFTKNPIMKVNASFFCFQTDMKVAVM